MPDPENTKQKWEQGLLAKTLAAQPERKTTFVTASGTPVERLDTPPDAGTDPAYAEKLGFPGEYPYTRGIYPTMYRGRLWTMRQYAGFSTAEESNKRYRYLLEQGSTGLSVAFDLPTQIGYDSDQLLAHGDVHGEQDRGGGIDRHARGDLVERDAVEERAHVVEGVDGDADLPHLAAGEEQGVSPAQLKGTIQNDILKEYIARGTYRFPPRPSLRIIRDIFGYCTESMPQWNTISISGYHIREAGSTAAQEIAFTFADAICYIDTALAAGLAIDDFAPRLSFFFAAHTDLFEEAAKFRAARRLYAKIVRERFGAKDPKSWMLRFHTQTGGVTLTAQQVDNNVVRVTLQALASVLGGTQSLHTNAKDEAVSLPAEQAALVALRTQQIIAEESGVTSTIDPLGGSYFVEALTDKLEADAEKIIAEIDRMGGVVTAIERGWVQQQIEKAAYAFGQSIERNERIIVGVNKYQNKNDPPPEVFSLSTDSEHRQVEKLKAIRANRDPARVAGALSKLNTAATGTANLMPFIIEAVKASATIGEICDVLQGVFGQYENK